jgi:hypothetical protein
MVKKTSKLTAKPRKKSSTAKSKAAKKKAEELKDRKKLMELTLKAFQMTYEDYQRGEFHRIF